MYTLKWDLFLPLKKKKKKIPFLALVNIQIVQKEEKIENCVWNS